MGEEIDLLVEYPKTKRDLLKRLASKTEESRRIARQFGKEFFDGDRQNGYGGFSYQPRFWKPVVPYFQKRYNLTAKSSVLDIGCAKGFMLYDFIQAIPNMPIRGVDISEYAIQNSHSEVRDYLSVADARELPFEDSSFDLVISINTIHNLEGEDLKRSLKEISRISKKNAFIVNDAYRNEQEKESMFSWNLTAKTILHVEEWKQLFREVGYDGDYYWFIP